MSLDIRPLTNACLAQIATEYQQHPTSTLSLAYFRAWLSMQDCQIIQYDDQWSIFDPNSNFIHYIHSTEDIFPFLLLLRDYFPDKRLKGIIPAKILPKSHLVNHEISYRSYFKLQWISQNKNKLVPLSVPLFESNDVQAHTDFINRCYNDIKVAAHQIYTLKNSAQYFDEGWFFLGTQNDLQASAIVLFDAKPVIEGYLDWIQVHPNYRGQGIGKQLVSECIRRIRTHNKQALITVAGDLNNPNNPQQLYKSVGFTNNTEWIYFSFNR